MKNPFHRHNFELVAPNKGHSTLCEIANKLVPQCTGCKKVCNARMHYGRHHNCDALRDIQNFYVSENPANW